MTPKILFVAALLMLATYQHSSAQLSQGTLLVGGTLQTSRSNSTSEIQGVKTDTKMFNVNLSPNVSYFIIHNLSLGIVTPYDFSKTKDSNKLDTWTSTYSVGPTVRYYFPFGSWAVFPTVSYTYGWSTTKQKYSPPLDFLGYYKLYSNTSTFNGGVGITYFLNEHVGIEGIFAYQKSTSDTAVEDRDFYNLERSDLAFSVGIQVYFGIK